jgi:bifunctional isochorismate lyase / aryl carrier protein
MGIPNIQSYPMPRADDLPENRVSWSLDPRRAVLLIHDMQQYFLDYYDRQAPPATELLANIRLVRERCASRGIPIVYTKQPAEQSPEQRGLLLDFWGPGLTKHPHRQEIVDDLAPGDADSVLTKWCYSAFQRTELLGLLRRWRRDQLIICGVYAHIGCLMTACEAFMNNVQPFLVGDATSDFSLDHHKMAITYVAQRCGVAVSTHDVVAALDRDPNARIAPRNASSSASVDVTRDRVLSMENLRSELSELLQLQATEIPDREPLLDLGLDSIRLMTLVEWLRTMEIDITFVELAERATLADWWELLSSRLPLDARLS